MSKVKFLNSYKLKKGSSVEDFLKAVESLNKEHISKQKGYISFELFVDKETWADCTTFETMEDALSFSEAKDESGTAQNFYSFLNFSTCKSNFYTIEKTFSI